MYHSREKLKNSLLSEWNNLKHLHLVVCIKSFKFFHYVFFLWEVFYTLPCWCTALSPLSYKNFSLSPFVLTCPSASPSLPFCEMLDQKVQRQVVTMVSLQRHTRYSQEVKFLSRGQHMQVLCPRHLVLCGQLWLKRENKCQINQTWKFAFNKQILYGIV